MNYYLLLVGCHEGTDFAGIVKEKGAGVTKFEAGDEVVGHTDNRASHAEYVVVSEDNLLVKPESVSWEVAGSLWVAGTAAYAGIQAVTIKPGDKVVVTGAAGGVGSIAVQLARLAGADVYGVAGEYDRDWLKALGVTPIDYRDDVAAQIDSLVGLPDAMIDTVDKGYVKLAIELGVKPDRINTLIDYAAVEKYGTKSDGNAAAANNKVLEQLLRRIAEGDTTIPITETFPLDDVREAFEFLAGQHHRGKVVLLP